MDTPMINILTNCGQTIKSIGIISNVPSIRAAITPQPTLDNVTHNTHLLPQPMINSLTNFGLSIPFSSLSFRFAHFDDFTVSFAVSAAIESCILHISSRALRACIPGVVERSELTRE
jgi:hypothetical protein